MAPSLTRLPLKSEEEEEEEELKTGRGEWGLEPWTKKKAGRGGGGEHGNVKLTLIHI